MTKKKSPDEKLKTGRPEFEYCPETANEICERISTSSKGIVSILKELATDDRFGRTPKVTTVYKWLDSQPEFAKRYAISRQQQSHLLAEEIIAIADDDSLDVGFTDDGKPYIDKEHINRSRLRVDARKWVASKLLPKVYGDKPPVDDDAAEVAKPLTVNINMVDAKRD